MNIVEVYKLCKNSGINITVKNGNLRVTSENEDIPESVKGLLKKHKQEMIELLSAGAPKDNALSSQRERTLSYSQQRLWFQQQYNEQSAIYNVPVTLKCEALLNQSALLASIQLLIQRHEILRTVIKNEHGVATQQVLNVEDFTIESHREFKSGKTIETLANAQTAQPFDLSSDFMIRVSTLEQEHGSVIFITLHHIAIDGWSIDILLRELNIAYEALVSDKTPNLNSLQFQFSDFAAWEHEKLQGESLQLLRQYWTQRLAELPELHHFPTDRVRPAEPSYKGDRLRFELDSNTSATLQAFALANGATLFSLVQAAFSVFIARYSGSNDVVLGTPTANREIPDVQQMIGYFSNTLAIRTSINSSHTFEQLLQQVQANILNDFSHQSMPMEMLIDELKLQRKSSHNPLFQMMLVFENHDQSVSNSSAQVNKLQPYSLTRNNTGSKFDLTLIARTAEQGLAFAWEYAEDLFDIASIQRFADNFTLLLQSIAQSPDSLLSELNFISPSEKETVLQAGTGAICPIESSLAIHHLVEQQAAHHPDSVALIHNEVELSYQQLNEQANSIAHSLLSCGIKKGDLVGICTHQSIAFPVAVLGILKAGGAYLPLDPDYPAERIDHIVKDSGATLWLVEGTAELLSPYNLDLKEISRLALAHSNIDSVNIQITADDLAYVIYTSGSTGQPKGTLLRHGGATNLVMEQKQRFSISPENKTKILQFASVSFDAATWEILMSLCNGACLVIPTIEDKHTPKNMEKLIANHHITHATLPPAYLSLFQPDQLPTLTHLIVAGEAVSQSEAEKWSQHCQFFNAYGPTETTVCASIGLYKDGLVHIGRPIRNHKCIVLDEKGVCVPVGVTGELYLGGVGLAQGYLNNAELTQDKFIELTLSSGNKERFYRSGDLVRWLPSFELEFVGRRDNQVQIRGFRVELGEIENTLASHPEVSGCAVKAEYLENGRTQLVVYFIPSNKNVQLVSRDSVKHFISQRLPSYMVPTAFVPVNELPLTIHGKVDLASLPKATESDLVRTCYVAPENDLQRLICSILEDLLKVEQVGIQDNFFALGGDSILSIQAVSRINHYGYQLTSSQFFNCPTVEKIAELLTESKACQAIFTQDDSSGELALSPIQQRFFGMKNTNNSRYLQSALLHVPEAIGEDFFSQYISALLAQQDLLRVRFSNLTSELPSAHFEPITSIDIKDILSVESLKGLNEEERVNKLAALGDDYKSTISLTNGHLFKFIYFEADCAAQSRLLIVFHHLLIDGVSWRIILNEIKSAYQQYIAQNKIRLAPKATRFHDWSVKLADWTNSDAAIEEMNYWNNKHQQNESLVQKEVSGGEDNSLATTQYVTAKLSPHDTQALLQNCHQAYRTQINDLLLSALMLALNKWRNVQSYSVFMEGHGREDELFDNTDLTKCVGWFTSLYPVLLENKSTLGSTILHTKEQLRHIPQKGLGYLASKYLTSNASNLTSDMDIVFNYLGQFDQQFSKKMLFAKAEEYTGFDVDRSREREYTLGFNGSIANGELSFDIDFNQHLFEKVDVDQLAKEFESALQTLIRNCEAQPIASCSPSDFALCNISQAELNQYQAEFGEIEDLYPASDIQMGLYFHSQLESESNYLTQNILHFEQGFDPIAFKQVWQQVITRHAVLRTLFVGTEREQSLQLVLRNMPMNWNEIDLSMTATDEQESRLNDYLKQDKQQAIDYTLGPLYRFTTFNLGGGRFSFVWTCSHTILDGWSLGVIYDEVLQLYKAQSENRDIKLPQVLPFKNYIEWIEKQNNEASHQFWQQELAEIEFSDKIGIEEPNVNGTSVGSRALRQEWDEQDYHAIKAFAAQHAITINTLIQAAWGYLLCRYKGSNKTLTGVSVSGRTGEIKGIESMVGMMINTVPARLTITPEQAITDWLQELHAVQAKREHYSFVSLTAMLGQLSLQEDEQLFNSVLGFHNQPIEEAAELMRKENMRGGLGYEDTHYPLVLGVYPHKKLQFTLIYDTAKFSAETMGRVFTHLNNIIKALVDPSNTFLNDICVFSAQELHELNTLSSNTQSLVAPLIPTMLTAQGQCHGERVAIVCEDAQVSFSGLDAKANQVARQLQQDGLTQGDRVGLCLDRSVAMTVAMLGIMKAGGVYVPLDPSYPDERLRYLLNDAQVQFVVSEAYLADQLPLATQKIILMSALDAVSTAPVACEITRESAAYIIYTSGSTGQPKGVCVNHGALADKIAGLSQHYGLDSTDVGLLFASMSFDASLSQLLMPLSVGARVVIRPDDITEPEDLMAYLQAQHVSVMHIVPAYLKQLVHLGGWSESALRIVISGGDVFDNELQQSWHCSERANIALYNSYGPTEICITSSSYRVTGKESVVPIGQPLANVSYWVLDGAGQLLPQGAIGELYIGGSSLASGYWQQKEQSDERFVTLALGDGPKLALYRTGDRVRWNDNGELVFIGRQDKQVKVRGYRIELGEIEAGLLRCEGVTGAVVTTYEDSIWAFVSLSSGDLAQVEDALSEQLPGYLLPNGYDKVEAWPLTANGKVDRGGLVRGQDKVQASRAPSNATELALHGIWTALLKIEEVGVTENFFQMGGHSLLATRLASQIRRQFEVNFSLKSLFELPSIEEQANLVDLLRAAIDLPIKDDEERLEEIEL